MIRQFSQRRKCGKIAYLARQKGNSAAAWKLAPQTPDRRYRGWSRNLIHLNSDSDCAAANEPSMTANSVLPAPVRALNCCIFVTSLEKSDITQWDEHFLGRHICWWCGASLSLSAIGDLI